MVKALEIWKPITGYVGHYDVSNMGRIKSLRRVTPHNTNRKERILKSDTWGRYAQVSLYVNNINRVYKIHRLVAKEFIPNPNRKPYINHINGNRYDNRDVNLEWCTAKENVIHSFEKLGRTGLFGTNNGMAKLTNMQIAKIRILKKSGISKKEIISKYKISNSYFYRIINNETRKI